MVDHINEPKAPKRQGQAETQNPDSAPKDSGAGERVAKALARAGVASRREVERYIAEGRVALNGRVLDTPAVKIGPGDVLTVDGAPVAAAEPTRVWRYHKPVGLVTSHKDPHERPTVFEALPSGLPRVISVGRLDLNSEGLLLLTNDGGLSRALELPSSGWVRRYRARAYGRTSQEALDRLQNGITVEGVVYGAIDAKLDKVQRRPGETAESSANCWITVSLTEGKNREVRRVLEALGLKVNRLVRLSYGPFALGTLAMGSVEEVGPRVIREQLAEFIAPENLPTGERTPAPIAAPGRRPSGSAAATPLGGTGAPEKKVYKPGWAKPSKPKNPHFRPAKHKPADNAAAAHPAGRPSGRPTSRPESRADDRSANSGPAGRPAGGPSGRPTGRPEGRPDDRSANSRPTGGPTGHAAGGPSGRPTSRPEGRADDRPANSRPTGGPAGRPAGGPSSRPSSRPEGRADDRSTNKRPTGGPAGHAAGGPSSRPSSRPEGRADERPANKRPAGGPAGRPTGGPSGRPAGRPTGGGPSGGGPSGRRGPTKPRA